MWDLVLWGFKYEGNLRDDFFGETFDTVQFLRSDKLLRESGVGSPSGPLGGWEMDVRFEKGSTRCWGGFFMVKDPRLSHGVGCRRST